MARTNHTKVIGRQRFNLFLNGLVASGVSFRNVPGLGRRCGCLYHSDMIVRGVLTFTPVDSTHLHMVEEYVKVCDQTQGLHVLDVVTYPAYAREGWLPETLYVFRHRVPA